MADIRKLEALTDWITYDLMGTPLLSEPQIKVRLRYLDNLEAADEFMQNNMRSPLANAALALRAVAEWNLTEDGKPIPINRETKALYLRPLLGLPLALTVEEEALRDKKRASDAAGAEWDGPPIPIRKVLVYEIVEAAQDLDNFRKN
jgi:hypothetical protein